MNSSDGTATKRNRRALHLTAGGVLLFAHAPREASSFSSPRRTFCNPSSRVAGPATQQQQQIGGGVVTTRIASPLSSPISIFRKTTSQLSGHLAYLDSLNSITANPELFPATSNFLSRLDSPAAAEAAPSAEEFLTQLSTELLRASQEYDVVFQHSAASSSSSSSGSNLDNSLLRDLAEQTVPALASMAAVGAAAETYNPASYSNLRAQMGDSNGNSNFNGYATEYAAANNGAAGADTGHATDFMATQSTATIDGIDGGMTDSFASWHSQGGSNALRDLASSIPTVEQQDVSYAAQDTVGGLNDYYFGNGGFYLAENTAEVGQQVAPVVQDVVAGSGSGFDASAISNGYASSSLQLTDVPNAASTSNIMESITTASSSSDYLPMDGIPVEGVVDPALNTEAMNELSNSLSSQLSDLQYDGLQMNGGTAPAKAPLLGDFMKAKVTELTPQVKAKISELTPQIKEALSSAKEASGASKDKLGNLFSSISHSLDGLGDKVADVSHSFEGLSGQVGKVADAGLSSMKTVGSAVQSGAATVGEGIAGVGISAKAVGVGVAGMASSSSVKSVGEDLQPPSLDSRAPTLPDVHVQMPIVPDLNLHVPSLPDVDAQMPIVPDVNLHVPSLPDVDTPMPIVPQVNLHVPSLPDVDAQMPIVPQVDLHVPSLPDVDAQMPIMPQVNLHVPYLPQMDLPHLNMQVPSLPKMDLPHLNMQVPSFPKVSLPDLNIQTPVMPRINLPELHLQPPTLPKVEIQTPSLPSVDIQAPALPSTGIVEAKNSAMQHVGDSSLSSFGHGVVEAVQFTGGIIVKFLDLILGAVAGTSFSSIFNNVHTSVTSVIDNAVHTVVSTINAIGDMSIKEIIQHLMALIIAITDILLKVMNAVVYLISGKDGGDWALQATSTVNEASSQLLAQASSSYDHVTHTTLAELAHTVGDYSHYVGNELVALVGSLNGVSDGTILLDGVPLDHNMLDNLATTVQTALSL